MTNVYEVDATTIDADGVTVPTDVDGVDEGYQLSRSVKSDWAIKVVNDADAEIDATPLVSTSDDPALEEYAEDGDAETVASGDVPDNVTYFSGETVAAFLGVELTAEVSPTEGTAKIVFNSRLYGGA